MHLALRETPSTAALHYINIALSPTALQQLAVIQKREGLTQYEALERAIQNYYGEGSHDSIEKHEVKP